MSPKERAIAEAALRGYPARNYPELFAQIAEYTGFTPEEVAEILHDLTTDATLVSKIRPLLSRTPQLAGAVEIVQQWYEKGSMWGTPRLPRKW